MRTAILNLPDRRTESERRKVLRVAIRQLERADLYLAAVACMELGDAAAQLAVRKLRADLEAVREHLAGSRAVLDS